MARLPRLTLSGYPHHVVQRGNNRESIFTAATDRQFLLDLLRENARKWGVALHAYVLMDNHFHLLATPTTEDGLPHMMQAVGRSYVRYFNDKTHRSGTLWDGRYKSTVIQAEAYLLICMAYMDLNPVRAGTVSFPAAYPWSSHGHYVGQRVDPLITPHPLVWELGNTPFAREAGYADILKSGISSTQQHALTQSVLLGWALGDDKFVASLQGKTTRRVSKGLAGRPPLVKNLLP